MPIENTFTEFDDQVSYDAIARIADSLIERYITGKVDRVDVVYTKFLSSSKQIATVETLLPFATLEMPSTDSSKSVASTQGIRDDYEFSPFCRCDFGRSCSCKFPSKIVQMLLGCSGERTDRTDGRNEERQQRTQAT